MPDPARDRAAPEREQTAARNHQNDRLREVRHAYHTADRTLREPSRIEDYQALLGRFATALRELPEEQRQHSSLPLIHQRASPLPARFGTSVPSSRFLRAASDAGLEIPGLGKAFIAKCLNDVARLGLI